MPNVIDPKFNVPGLFLGSPDGRTPPSPLLTHWVGWDGGFNAWAAPIGIEYILVCLNENGEDWGSVTDEGNWTLAVIRMSDAEPVHQSEASPVNLQTALEQLVMINWKERDEL